MIRVAVADDHPALRAGLHTVLRAEPGFVPVGMVESGDEISGLLEHEPDVLLLDYHLPGENGLLTCHRLKRSRADVRVLIFSAYADADLAIPAIVAGADGLINKRAPAEELFDAIRRIARGEAILPAIDRDLLTQASSKLEEDDLPVLGMLLERTPLPEVAEALRIDEADVEARVARILERLKVDTAG